ncbi:farnesyl pyrophosphate synthase-like [Vespa mandarinia]|uniref:farnesyl pyrophosphate synthase-like n=1 Tax=Vespa mandarinia TaxID=7446 RepID=UPI0016119B38|nr:farnesyl pyrophosphate synthase-like [Vespa mandarinia]XP_035743868.1 farnesyl pyrophosphate synthase-like [Vespa mandarinia]
MSFSVTGRRVITFCGNEFYRKHTKFVSLDKIQLFRTTNAKIGMAAHITTQKTWMTSKDESREIMALWPDIVRDITNINYYLDIPEVSKWMAKVLQYNVPNGRKRRALILVYAYQMLVPSDQLTKENIRLARILGWCVELLQAFLLIIDDIQDKSHVRRNQTCWYLHNDIGLGAINDALMIEQAAYQILYIHLKEKECYIDIVDLFHKITSKTILGQCLDLLSNNFGKKINLNQFTMDRYNSIVKYKTAYYGFLLPVQIAMYLANIKDPEMHRQVKTILLEMGHLYQVQDDYLDCYGNSTVTGKDSTDIQEGKCSWLIVVALQRATPEQRKILEECYGSKDPEKIERVKSLYNDIGLSNTYSIYEEETYNLLNTHIQQVSRGLPHDFFFNLLKKIYHRVN